MNSTGKVLLLAVLCAAALADLDSRLDRHWDMWKMTYGKKYLNKVEEVNRRAVWEKNLMKINTHNLEESMGQHTYTMAMNHMGDLTKEEALQMYANLRIPKGQKRSSSLFKTTNADVPDSLDWRKKGYVTSVKNQGSCGSCWAFSVVGSMEGFYFNKTGRLLDLSPQELVDCSKDEDQGCGGGYMTKGFEFVIDFGLEEEADYPYKAEDDQCHYIKEKVKATCSAYAEVEKGNEAALKEATATFGPISVGIDADPILYYSSGVFSEADCTAEYLDHGVVVVGYGSEGGNDYWLLKNSWGPEWGEDGYIRMARNKDDMCGIASYAHFCYA